MAQSLQEVAIKFCRWYFAGLSSQDNRMFLYIVIWLIAGAMMFMVDSPFIALMLAAVSAMNLAFYLLATRGKDWYQDR